MAQDHTAKARSIELPQISEKLMGGFRVFNRMYLRKHFHVLGVNQQALQPLRFTGDDALVIYANHASWWDPLVAIFLAEQLFPEFRMYAPIDALAFEKYRIFGKMGFFPIASNSLRGAGNFLRVSRELLSQPRASIWITPEGRFADARDHSANFMPGLAHLASALCGQSRPAKSETATSLGVSRIWFLSLALEYTFWEERKPELLAWMGEPILVDRQQAPQEELAKADWDERLQASLRQAQTELAQAAIARDDQKFDILLKQKSGTFFAYDWIRRVQSKLKGAAIDVDHSDKFSKSD